jgi:DNA-binding NtrC family response regulator
MNSLAQSYPKDTRNVLLIDDDEEFCNAFAKTSSKFHLYTEESRSYESAASIIKSNSFAAVLVDSNFDQKNNFEILKTLLRDRPLTKIFALVHNQSIDLIPTYLERGASNVIPISLGAEAIAKKIDGELSKETPLEPASCPIDYPKIIGRSHQHVEILEKINQIKDVDASVLVTGESGTGKELVARALHEASTRSRARFDAINCGAIPENLLESELFGHKRGAFTDAKIEKKGLFEVCSHGTLLLDEIGELPLNLQVKLLRVLQEREVKPIGSTNTVKIGTRIIAATNRDLQTEVDKGTFRRDLYYRLSVLKIHIQPLRDRCEDIPLLVNNFIKRYSRTYNKEIKPLSTSVLARIEGYPWHGNIRELQNAIERAVILSKFGRIDPNDIFEDNFSTNNTFGLNTSASTPMPIKYHKAKKDFETRYLQNLLKRTAGNVSEAARMAGKTRVEIYRYLDRNQLKPCEYRN